MANEENMQDVISAEDLNLVLEAEANRNKLTAGTKTLFKALIQVIFGKKVSPDDVDLEEFNKLMNEVSVMLSPRERDFIRLRFGMDDGVIRSLESVGQLFGISIEEAQQIEAKFTRKLRHPNGSYIFKKFLTDENINIPSDN